MKRLICLPIFLLLLTNPAHIFAQVEVEPWGNVTGIRTHGQLMEFESSIRVSAGNKESETAMERQHPKFRRDGRNQIVNTSIDSLFFAETVRDAGMGRIKLNLKLFAHADTTVNTYLCIRVPFTDSSATNISLIKPDKAPLSTLPTATYNEYVSAPAKGISLNTALQNIKITTDHAVNITVKKDWSKTDTGRNLMVYLSLQSGKIKKGDSIERQFIINVSGPIDRQPVNFVLNTNQTGRVFMGFGGNFRLQNPKGDPQVIDYCLDNMRVAYARAEMPWRFWQPDADKDPTAEAKAGNLHPAVQKAMEMEGRLGKMNIPLILSAWFPPQWAAVGKLNMQPVNGIWGNELDTTKYPAIFKSIGDYIIYLRDNYGVEPKLFSFNESDLGINIRFTGEGHDKFTKGLGAYFAAHGIHTKMLLGDNSDATTYQFIYPTMNDPEARQYIGAISFHSWRGWDTPTLQKWADAASKMDLPLIVGEGSIDAQAYGYPQIFKEQVYALKEITLYARLLAICQPLSILQWQLTSDYSPLIGGGLFGDNSPLRPTQRFWQLKQLASTPKDLAAMPVAVDRPLIVCAALGDNDRGAYAIHIVNNGAKREATLTGLPDKVKSLKVYVTNKKSNMKLAQTVEVKGGAIEFKLPAASYVSVFAGE